MSTEEFKMQYLGAILKWQNDLCSFPRQTIQYHSNPSQCPNQYSEEAGIEQFYEDLQDLLELTPKRCLFHHTGLECKSRKSRDTWSNRQIWSCSTEWTMAKAISVLPRECTGHSKHPLLTTQKKTLHMDVIRWSIPKSDWLYSLQPKRTSIHSTKQNEAKQNKELTVALIVNSLPNSDVNWRKYGKPIDHSGMT